MNHDRYILDVTEADFRTEVLERSRTDLVLVDFWAQWCRPCRQLGPLLEKLASHPPGRFVLARINTDLQSGLAASLRVQSIPTVLFFREGRVIDEFVGTLPESALEELIARHTPSPAAGIARAAEASEAAGDLARAEAAWQQILAQEPDHEGARFGMARVLLRTDRVRLAADHLRRVTSLAADARAAERLTAALPFFELSTTRKQPDQDPGDLPSRLRRAAGFATSNQLTAAMDELLAILAIDKTFEDGLARKAMLALFVLSGPSSDTTRQYQDRLARLLY
ncbi:MAG: tetratricopeptide repeat protein [Planctomycetota bacterium]